MMIIISFCRSSNAASGAFSGNGSQSPSLELASGSDQLPGWNPGRSVLAGRAGGSESELDETGKSLSGDGAGVCAVADTSG